MRGLDLPSHARDSPPPGTLRCEDGSALEQDSLRSGGDGIFIPDEDDFNDVCIMWYSLRPFSICTLVFVCGC